MPELLDRLQSALADRYRIEREIGAGGMATVYLAQDLRHDRQVALKVLRPELAAVIGAERFLAEIKLTANLQHPHILPLFDSGEADGYLFYVMPFVEGEIAARPAQPREAAPRRRGGPDRDRGGLRARLRAPARRRPPRHQAREHPAARRPGAGGRLRHRARGQQGGRQPDDRDRDVARHAALHEPRAGDGRARDHRPLRRLRARRRALRDAHRRPAVHRLDRAGDRGPGGDRERRGRSRRSATRSRRTSRRRCSPRSRSSRPTGSPPRRSSPRRSTGTRLSGGVDRGDGRGVPAAAAGAGRRGCEPP